MATVEPISEQPISDDQELAKVLAGVNQQAEEAQAAGTGSTFTAPSDAAAATPPANDAPTTDAPVTEDDTPAPQDTPSAPVVPPVQESAPVSAPVSDAAPASGGELDGVKQEALNELRPLVDKLDVSPEEKFDTYLLLLRSTDDKALITPAHDAAKNIADEARRAQALLDIIKEIDFLSQK